MDLLEVRPSRLLLYLTVCLSLLAHVAILIAPWHALRMTKPPLRLEVQLPPTAISPAARSAATATEQPSMVSPSTPPPSPPASQAWISGVAKRKPLPRARPPEAIAPAHTTAEPSRVGGNTISVERVPHGAPLNKTELQIYLDALRRKLYHMADLMHHPESTGSRTAAVRLSINSDGTMKSLTVLDEADQKEEVAFTLRLLDLSAPYPPFPPSLAASIRSFDITFCIKPPQNTDPDTEHSGRFGC